MDRDKDKSAPKTEAKKEPKRVRARQMGLRIGQYPRGRHNAITDVPKVRVGHSTIVQGKGKLRPGRGPIRTGVTAILPNEGNIFEHRVAGSGFILNGAGEVSGLTQVMEWGLIETPILLTNTLSVGAVSEAVVKYMVEKHPTIGVEQDVVIPLVGECDDSWLNDVGGRHVRYQHVVEAIEGATGGPVAEGNVGGGTGMVTCEFKGGIGTSSRRLPEQEGGYVVGVLVMSNFGRMVDLRVDGIPVGEILAPEFADHQLRQDSYGSIIVVVGTNAPLLPHQINRLCKRAALGLARVGSHAAHGSGEIMIGFSTANQIPRETRKMVYRMKFLLDRRMNPLYQATVEATEEAILNALFMADTMEGHSGHVAPALPIKRVREILRSRGWVFKEPRKHDDKEHAPEAPGKPSDPAPAKQQRGKAPPPG
jgi:D-aminopeptidase